MNEKDLLDYLVKNKEIYRLWFEYLRENEVYREFCEKVTRENFPLGSIRTKDKYNIRDTYQVWGDVNNVTWETMFNNLQKKLVSYIKFKEYTISFFSDTKSTATKIHEYKIYAVMTNKKQTLDDAINFFEMIEAVDNFPKLSRNLPPKEIESIWQYLTIYRTRKNNICLSWKEIRDIVDPESNIYRGINFTDQCRESYRKAQRIIENVGKNLFPGIYAKPSKAKKTKKKE